MSSSEEIWSTRLQRELLALTTTDDESKKNIGVLPPFITVKEHSLDIAEGKCAVSFTIEVDTVDKADGAEEKSEGEEQNTNPEKEKEIEADNKEENESTNTSSTAEAPAPSSISSNTIVITLDASLQRKSSFSSPDASMSYPFFKPKAYVTSGTHLLPSSTELSDGSSIQIDCDWTPSLHLNDAALNIALKVRESVKRGELCLKVERDHPSTEANFDAKVSSFFSSLKSKATAIVEEVDNKLDVAMRENPRLQRKKELNQQTVEKIVTEENVEIGDVIDLSQRPWNAAVGMYPCRAIRRPAFVEEAMQAVNMKINNNKVAGSGFKGAGTMFKSFSKTAKSLVEEAFLVLTKELILEIKCNKFAVSSATVTFCIPISQLSKLKFRREESISLFFKPAPEDPIIYMCQSSADAVKQIQLVLKKHGVKGKHTNTTMMKTVQVAVEYLNDVKVNEKELKNDPRPERVTVIMDLYRQAAEKFEMAGDKRHEETMSLMREFLAQPHVSGILDGSIKPKDDEFEESEILQPVTNDNNLDTSVDYDEDEEEDEGDNESDKEFDDLDKAMKAAEDMLNNAHDGLKDLDVDDEDIEESYSDDIDSLAILSATPKSKKETDVDVDVVSEFEDLLANADRELEELMGS